MAPCPNIKPTRHSLELAIFHIQAMAQQAEEGAITLEFSPWRGQCWENGEKRLLKSKHHTEIIGDVGVIDDMRLFENGRFTSMFGYLDKENDETSNLWDPNFRQNQNGEFIQKVEFHL